MEMLQVSLDDAAKLVKALNDLEAEFFYIKKASVVSDHQKVGVIKWSEDAGSYYFKPNKKYFKI